MKMGIYEIIEEFIENIKKKEIIIYNEFSLQHELGIFLRKKMEKKKYIIEFERNTGYFDINELRKTEIDIVIRDEKKSKIMCYRVKMPIKKQFRTTK